MPLCALRKTAWLILWCGALATYALAEDITVTTYYPSPRGVYRELWTTDLEVGGHLRLNSAASGVRQPACTEERRGTLWFARDVRQPGESRVVDRLEFCARFEGRYAWVAVLGGLDPL